MIQQILQFLLEVISGLVAGACLLRMYMQAQRIPFNNPVGQLVFALSNWLVLPLRKFLPAKGKYDWASLAGALLVMVVQYLLLWLLIGILIVYAILSWVQPQSPIASILYRLSEPLLRPLRKVIPLIGGVDLSALAAIIVIQILLMVLASVQFNVLAGVAAL